MNAFIVGAASAALGLASIAQAGQVQMHDASGGLNGIEGTGGAFRVQVLNGFNGLTGGPGGSANSFSSFCLERTETISFGNIYNTTISTSAINGGHSGGNPDPISEETAWLYRQFRDSAPINGWIVDGAHNYGGGLGPSRLASALQLAIWLSEGEILNTTTWDGLGDATTRTAAQQMYDAAALATAQRSGDFYGVRVLRLYGIDGGNSQDQLTIVPLPSAGWAGLSTLAGVGVVGYIRRRKLATM